LSGANSAGAVAHRENRRSRAETWNKGERFEVEIVLVQIRIAGHSLSSCKKAFQMEG
jgi:hypothetical protein